MARKIKIDNAILKRRAYRSGKKEIGKKKQREYILIVCEGTKTEPNYFEAIKETFPKKILETYRIDVEGTGTSTLKIVEIAIGLRKQAKKLHNRIYDYVWVVFDRDSFPVVDFNNSIFKAQSSNIDCAWSNEAFELWYVLHFQYRNTPMAREDYKKGIETEMNKNILKKTGKVSSFIYKKNSKEMYNLLKEFGNEEQAIKWAKKLEVQFTDTNYSSHNPCTRVYKLIEQLNEIRESNN